MSPRSFDKIECGLTLFDRYLITVLNGTRNPHRSGVAMDIVNAILKTRSTPDTPSTYWTKEVQAVRLKEAFEKWQKVPDVWSAAALKVRVT